MHSNFLLMLLSYLWLWPNLLFSLASLTCPPSLCYPWNICFSWLSELKKKWKLCPSRSLSNIHMKPLPSTKSIDSAQQENQMRRLNRTTHDVWEGTLNTQGEYLYSFLVCENFRKPKSLSGNETWNFKSAEWGAAGHTVETDIREIGISLRLILKLGQNTNQSNMHQHQPLD